MKRILAVLVAGCVLAVAGAAAAAEAGSKDEAVALVKKAIGFMQANGADKA